MMKKAITILLALVMVLSLVACGKSEAVKKTEEAITAIGEVSVGSDEAIRNAEKLYNILSDKEKEKVSNRLTLIEARDKYNEVVAEIAAREAAEAAAKQQAEEKIENAMFLALQAAIKFKQSYMSNPNWVSMIDPSRTQYTLTVKEMSGDNYRFCGTCYLYDSNGQPCAKFVGGTSKSANFEIILTPSLEVVSFSIE